MPKREMSLSEVEAGLERLMPRGLSDDALSRLEGLVDEQVAEQELPVRNDWKRGLLSCAALFAISFALVTWWAKSPSGAELAVASLMSTPSKISILERNSWIEGETELGLQVIAETGEAHQGYGFVGVEEERVRHEESGYEVVLQREFEAEFFTASSL